MQCYEMGKLIGTGSFGDVFLCKHRQEQRKFYVAKKLNLNELDSQGRQNIENQLKMLQTFRHPNIVPFKDSFITDRGLFIIMTYCQSGDLYSRIRTVKDKGKMFSEGQILDWFVQIALAIHYLHCRRILHRDLKSQNLFLKVEEKEKEERDRDGNEEIKLEKVERIRLGDFGIAKVLDQNQDLTATTAIGSPFYMAPEVFNKNIYSYKSDIWSLGCIIYELCNLRTPFDAQSRNGLIMKVIKGSYPTITPSYSKQLRDLIGQMLEKKPNKRPSIIQIINKPFIKNRLDKYIREILYRSDRRNIDIDDVYLDSLRLQLKNLNIPLVSEPFKKRRRTIYDSSSQQLTQEEQLQAFVNKRNKQMMEDHSTSHSENFEPPYSRTPSKKQKKQWEEYNDNIKTFQLMEEYSMEDGEVFDDNSYEIQEEEQQYLEQSMPFYRKQLLTPKNTSPTYYKLYNQIQVLNNSCENALGPIKFVRAVQLVEKGTNRQAMVEVLGEEQIGYWHMLQQALYYQQILQQLQQKEEQL